MASVSDVVVWRFLSVTKRLVMPATLYPSCAVDSCHRAAQPICMDKGGCCLAVLSDKPITKVNVVRLNAVVFTQ